MTQPNTCKQRIVLEFGLVSLGLRCFSRLSCAGLIVVLTPGCCWVLCVLRVTHVNSVGGCVMIIYASAMFQCHKRVSLHYQEIN